MRAVGGGTETKNRTKNGARVVVLSIALGLGCSDGPPPAPPSPWTPLFDGVDFRRDEKTKAWDATMARIQRVSALRIDLTRDVTFVTPEPGDLPPITGQQHVATTGRTLTDYLNVYPEVSAAINGSFFWPCCTYAGGPPVAMSLFGLNVSDGVEVSTYSLIQTLHGGTETTNVPDARWVGATSLVITRDKKVRIVEATTQHPVEIPIDEIAVAVSGGAHPGSGRCPTPDQCDLAWPPQLPIQKPNHTDYPSMLVKDGQTRYVQDDAIAGRVAAGVSADGRYLTLITVDGGADGAVPPEGASLYDLARWMQAFGADDALNLDGGGSTTMAMGTDGIIPEGVSCPTVGRGVPLNVPWGDRATRCRERIVGSFLGVTAPPLP